MAGMKEIESSVNVHDLRTGRSHLPFTELQDALH